MVFPVRRVRPPRSPWPTAVVGALLTACAGARAPASPRPATPPVPVPPSPGAPASALPPIAPVDGPLALHVVYPKENDLIEARDSTFVLGSVGSGLATLAVAGVPIAVKPNGAFLAFVAVPPPAAPHFDLVATKGRDTTRLSVPVRVLPPRVAPPLGGALLVDTASLTPRGPLALRDGERVRVSLRAPANARVTLATGGGPLSLAAQGEPTLFAADIPASALRASSMIVVTRDRETVRLPVPGVDPSPLTLAALGAADSLAVPDTDRVVVGRAIPGGTYKWFLLPGTVVVETGLNGGAARVRLDSLLEIWVDASDIRALPANTLAPRRTAGNVRVQPSAEWVDVVIPTGGSKPPYLVEELDRDIVLTLYGTQPNTDAVLYGANDSLVRTVEWAQPLPDRAVYTLRLAQRPFGYLAFWDHGAFVLRLRRTPAVSRDRPLAGLTIAVDPGHPPIGATGPTGLWEPEATLPVGVRLKELLQARGAAVVMTRTTAAPVPLGDRPVIARRANAHAFVSIHYNAYPDGVNPYASPATGTGTYFYRPQSEPLARAVQDGLVTRMGLRNVGVHYENFAVIRQTWMPAVLCEGAFIIIPEHEAAARTAAFQEAYARGIADGLEAFFRTLAR